MRAESLVPPLFAQSEARYPLPAVIAFSVISSQHLSWLSTYLDLPETFGQTKISNDAVPQEVLSVGPSVGPSVGQTGVGECENAHL